MAQDFDREGFMNARGFLWRGGSRPHSSEPGRKGYKRQAVGCGAPNRLMAMMEYWAQRIAVNTEIRRYFPAEFVNQNPASLDKDTLVILGSHSGTTKETVEAARYLQDKPCTTVGFTQKAGAPLAQAVKHPLPYGETKSGYYANYIMMQALVSGFLKVVEPGWQVHDKLLDALGALPDAWPRQPWGRRAGHEARLYRTTALCT